MSPRPAGTRRPRLYFSFRSPYSWLAVERLRARVPDAFGALEWFPFWDPDQQTSDGLAAHGAEFHYVQMSRAKHLYMLVDTKRIAQRDGLAMAWPIDRDPWWEPPHLAWLLARRLGRQEPFYDAVVEARWGRGEDVCSPAVLGAAADRAGIDPDLAVAATTDPEIREEAVGCLVQAYLDDIFGIPYLRLGRHRFWGLDRVGDFLEAWRPAVTATGDPETGIPAAVLAGPPYDTDTAGACG